VLRTRALNARRPVAVPSLFSLLPESLGARGKKYAREEPSNEKQTFSQHRSAVGRNGHGVGAERTKRRTRFRPCRPKPGCARRRGGTGSTGPAE
jgi:hypothetical protein